MFRTMSQTNNCDSCRVQKPSFNIISHYETYNVRGLKKKKKTIGNVNNIIITYYYCISFILEYKMSIII